MSISIREEMKIQKVLHKFWTGDVPAKMSTNNKGVTSIIKSYEVVAEMKHIDFLSHLDCIYTELCPICVNT